MTSTAITQPSLRSKDAVIGTTFSTQDEKQENSNGLVVDNELNGNSSHSGNDDSELKEERILDVIGNQPMAKIASSPPPISNHKFSDDSSELSELDDSEAETEKLEPLEDSDISPLPPILSHKRRRESSDVEADWGNGKGEEDDEENGRIDSVKKRKSIRNGKRQNTMAKEEAEEEEEEGEGEEEERNEYAAEDSNLKSDEVDSDSKRENGKEDVVKQQKEEMISSSNEKEIDKNHASENNEDINKSALENGSLIASTKVDRKQDHKHEEQEKPLSNDSAKPLQSESESEVDPKVTGQEKEHEDTRQRAIVLLTEIEIEFAKLRDQLHDDKMARFIAEIEMCADGTHPELSTVHSQITRIREEKIQLAEKKRAYQLKCINNQIKAMRDHLHQQFMKDEAECRVRLLLHTTEEWYKVNKERRAMDALAPEFSYQVPESKSSQIHNRIAVNSEISLLSGISDYIGFPAAPRMNPANESELLEDLEALGIQY